MEEKLVNKKKTRISIVSLLLIAVLILTGCGQTIEEKVPKLRDQTANHVYESIEKPKAGKLPDDGAVFNLKKSGAKVDKDYYDAYRKSAAKYAAKLKEGKEKIDYRALGEAAMAVKELGGDPKNVDGVNLIDYLNDQEAVKAAGLPAECYAAIALNYCKEDSESLHNYDQDVMDSIEYGKKYEGKMNEAEYNGLALMTLSYYKTMSMVAVAIDGSLNRLKDLQDKDGGFGSCQADATVACGLACVGVDPSTFKKDDDSKDLMTSLLSYETDGGFANKAKGKVDERATVLAFTALNMYSYRIDEKNYLMPDLK